VLIKESPSIKESVTIKARCWSCRAGPRIPGYRQLRTGRRQGCAGIDTLHKQLVPPDMGRRHLHTSSPERDTRPIRSC
jgi:hypothetical protein